jgi:hypothetical protein
MRDLESMFWKEILGRNNNEVSVSKISTVAQKRLARIDLDDTERIRIDCVSVANHNLIRLLDKPGVACIVCI